MGLVTGVSDELKPELVLELRAPARLSTATAGELVGGANFAG